MIPVCSSSEASGCSLRTDWPSQRSRAAWSRPRPCPLVAIYDLARVRYAVDLLPLLWSRTTSWRWSSPASDGSPDVVDDLLALEPN